MEHEPMIFEDLEPISIHVTLGKKKYLLREATEGVAVTWRNAMLKATKIGDKGRPTMMDGIADAEPLLVSLCLFEEGPMEGEFKRNVPVGVIRGWKASIVKKLHEKIKEISDLYETDNKEDKEGEEKNSSLNIKNDTLTPQEDTSSTSDYLKPLERDLITS
jgi:hypothetical protein